MRCFFHPEATRELNAAIDYYEDCAPGLGLDFSVEVQTAIERLLLFPAACPKLVDNVRRCLVNRFHLWYPVLIGRRADSYYRYHAPEQGSAILAKTSDIKKRVIHGKIPVNHHLRLSG